MHSFLKQGKVTGGKVCIVGGGSAGGCWYFSLKMHAVGEVIEDVDWLDACAASCI